MPKVLAPAPLGEIVNDAPEQMVPLLEVMVGVVLTVSVSTTPTITSNSGTICSGASFTISPSGAGASTFGISGGNFTVSPVLTTTYAVTGTSTAGCISSSV